MKSPQPGLGKRPDKSHVFPRKSAVPDTVPTGWLSRFLVSTENDGGLPGSPRHLLSRMSPRLDTLAFEGIYRDSCCPPPGRGGHPSYFGNREELVRVLRDSCPTQILTQRLLVSLPGQSPRRPNALSSCSRSQASLA